MKGFMFILERVGNDSKPLLVFFCHQCLIGKVSLHLLSCTQQEGNISKFNAISS